MATWRKLWKKALLNETVRRRGAKALGVLAYVLLMADDDGTASVSVRQLAVDLSLTHKEARGIIAAFAATGTLDVSGGREGTVIRLAKWAQYAEGTKRAQKGHTEGHTEGSCNKLEKKDLQKSDTDLGHTEGHTEGHKKGTQKGTKKEESSTLNNLRISEINSRDSRARVKEADICTTTRHHTRECVPYPENWEDVIKAAEAYAIVMTEDEAQGFLAKYASTGWMRAGVIITDWRYLLQPWHRNWQQVEIDKARRTNGSRCNDRGNAGAAGGDCWGQAKFSGKYGPATTEEEFLRMVGDDD